MCQTLRESRFLIMGSVLLIIFSVPHFDYDSLLY